MIMKNEVKVLCHSSIKISGSKIIYVDPFRIEKDLNDADYIFCTHSHYDHFSKEDIEKVIKDDTILVVTRDIEKEVLEIVKTEERLVLVEPEKKYKVKDLEFETTYAYNKNKPFHPKKNNWVRIYYYTRWGEILYCR